MTEYDQREELYAALGCKMMGSGVTGSASVSTTEGFGSSPNSPANTENAQLDRYNAVRDAGIDALGNYIIECYAKHRSPRIGEASELMAKAAVDSAARELTQCIVRDVMATYIDDATGTQVTESWWPGDPTC